MRALTIATLLVAGACHHEPAPRAEPATTGSTPAAAAPADQPAAVSTSEDPHLPKLREFRDRACACKDKACVDAVQKELIAWASADKSKTKPSDADAKAADEIMAAFEKCVEAAGGKL
jgi:hypothetical protein